MRTAPRTAMLALAALAALAPLQAGEPKATPPKAKPSPPDNSAEALTLAEMRVLADAELWAVIDTSYFVSLESLDDWIDDNADPDYQNLHDNGGAPVISQYTARFRPDRQDLSNVFQRWMGPYVTYQRGRTDVDNIYGYDRGTPLDLWDTPYYFYTPAGRVSPPMDITLDDYGDDFDRYVIVSFGPDRSFGGGDDIFYQFGSPPPALTMLTSVRPFVVRPGAPLRVKGYNFGAQGENVAVLIDGDEVTTAVRSWTTRLIQIDAPNVDSPTTVTVSMTQYGQPVDRPFDILIEPEPDTPTPSPSPSPSPTPRPRSTHWIVR